MKFFVTYCAMNQAVGANPMGHASLFLSYWPGPPHKIEVTNFWGFYGVPTTTPYSWLRKLKRGFAMDTDFWGNHGELRIEAIRFLDNGPGLDGVTFDISFEQFTQLKFLCKKMIADQKHAYKEITPRLKAREIEPHSRNIFDWEKWRASLAHTESRLKPFELHLSHTLFGLSSNNTHACKHMAIQLLRDIGIPACKLDEMIKSDFPRYAGKLAPIILHSEGPLHAHTKKNGQQVFFRQWESATAKEKTRLYWSLPPQHILSEDMALKHDFVFPESYQERLHAYTQQLQQIEKVILNHPLQGSNEQRRLQFIAALKHNATCFACVYRDASEPDFDQKFEAIELFLDDIYHHIQTEIDDGSLEATSLLWDESVRHLICKAMDKPSPSEIESVLRL